MKNGLYSIHIRMLDGVSGRNGGIMVLRDGLIRGGDSHFYYTGSYSFADGRWNPRDNSPWLSASGPRAAPTSRAGRRHAGPRPGRGHLIAKGLQRNKALLLLVIVVGVVWPYRGRLSRRWR